MAFKLRLCIKHNSQASHKQQHFITLKSSDTAGCVFPNSILGLHKRYSWSSRHLAQNNRALDTVFVTVDGGHRFTVRLYYSVVCTSSRTQKAEAEEEDRFYKLQVGHQACNLTLRQWLIGR